MSAIRRMYAISWLALASMTLPGCPPPQPDPGTTSGGSGDSEDTCGHFCDTPSAVTQLSAGENHMCALLDTGGVTCWGFNSFGVLGYGDPALQAVGDDEPASAVGRIRLGEPASLIRAGTYHTCAITASGVRCWGWGKGGRLGYGNTHTIGDDEHPESAGVVDLGGTAVDLALGMRHTCALLADGTVRCWGEASRLGNGSATDIGDDEPASASALVDLGGPARQIAAGYYGTCAVLESGALRCWGATRGYPGNSLVLSPASAGDVDVGGSVHVITAGEQQYCAILVDGSLRCWGENIHGELGYGHTEMIGDDETPSSAGPVDVGGLAVVAAAPHNHTCVVLDGGSVRCWGLSRQGLLGVGYGLDNVGDDELPTAIDPVDVGGPVASLASNFQSTCALLQSGSVRCWGYGNLGDGNGRIVGDNEPPSAELFVPVF